MSGKHSAILACVAFLLLVCTAPQALLSAPPEACSLLTQAEVNAALGVTAPLVKQTTAKICQWAPTGAKPGRDPSVVVTVQDAGTFDFAKKPVTSANLVKTPLSGVGDDAVYNTVTNVTATLHVKKADTYFEIHVYGFPIDQTKTIEKTLAQQIVAKLK